MSIIAPEQLRIEYGATIPVGHRLISCLVAQLSELLEGRNVALGTPIESRLKTIDSIEEKINRKKLDLSKLTDLQDLVGIRVIILFKRDLEIIGDIIKRNFDVISYEDTSTRLDDTQFGYQSDHFVIKIKDEWESVPTYKGLRELSAEIQVRTMAQHIWAAASHKLQYKQEENTPSPLRGSIYRVSALLETVDLELNRLSNERNAYIESINSRSKDLPLDVDVTAKILAELWPPKNLCPLEEEYNGLVNELKHFGIDTGGKLRSFILKQRDDGLKDEAEIIADFKIRDSVPDFISSRVERGFYFTQVALTRRCLHREFGYEEVSKITRQFISEKNDSPRKPRSRRSVTSE